MNTHQISINENILKNYKLPRFGSGTGSVGRGRESFTQSKTSRYDSLTELAPGKLNTPAFKSKAVREKNGLAPTDTPAAKNQADKINLCAAVKKDEYDCEKSPSKVSFGGLSSNKAFKWMLEKSADNGALCSASAMLLACCALRPASIMASKNVDLENRKVAATKSIASGIIGFVLMFLVSKPIEHAVKKINNKPQKFLKKRTIKKLIGVVKPTKEQIDSAKVYNLATRFFKMSADMIVAAPKGSLTIILIPPLLNMIFKNRTPKAETQTKSEANPLLQNTPSAADVENYANQRNYVFFKGSANAKTENLNNKVSFKGNPIARAYDSFLTKLAKFFGKILDNKKFQHIADKAKETAIENHVMAASGTIVSSFYVINTLKSQKIEEERKGPLIYNSVISWALATGGGYSVDKLMNKYLKSFEKHYKEVNASDTNLSKQLQGIKIMKSALIFGMMYRWVTPWISTILAEKVWNKKLNKSNTK